MLWETQMKITWTNCADAMPPDDAKIIINVNGNYDINTGYNMRYNMRYLICVQGWAFMRYIEWTPYTPEKWKELNNPDKE